jgi:hypothetical protein
MVPQAGPNPVVVPEVDPTSPYQRTATSKAMTPRMAAGMREIADRGRHADSLAAFSVVPVALQDPYPSFASTALSPPPAPVSSRA